MSCITFPDIKRGIDMIVLVVGGGGREHAIIRKLRENSEVEKIYALPGNGGIARDAECVPVKATDIEGIVAFAKKVRPDYAVVAPDDPLVMGCVDALTNIGIPCFGPEAKAAVIEGSKVFSKNLMKKYGIPTARYHTFEDISDAMYYLESSPIPTVVKADGLALGKGVIIAETRSEAKEAVKGMMQDHRFGKSGERIVIEEFLQGPEVSVLCFTDGKTVVPMISSMDHKRAGDGDTGLNTGGMGNFSPSPFFTKEVEEFCQKNIFQPTVDAMKAEGREFKGVIFFGLMLTEEGPKVLEYNARFGDPEAQVVLPRLKNDIIDVMEACIDGKLDEIDLQFSDEAAVCVVLASDGYPVSYKKGFPITGFDKFNNKDYFCFHAGTAFNDKGEIVTNGGRVLGITALGDTLVEARAKAYEATEWIDFENKYMRHDIANAILNN